jgi:hypothetical protein
LLLKEADEEGGGASDDTSTQSATSATWRESRRAEAFMQPAGADGDGLCFRKHDFVHEI